MAKMTSGMRLLAMTKAAEDRRMMDGPEMRRRRDSRGRYMEQDDGARMAYENNDAAYRPWPEPHIPPYLNQPGMNIRPGTERRGEYGDNMRDRNIVNIRDYQDKRRIGFGENRMHYDGHEDHEIGKAYHQMGNAHHMGEYPMAEHLTKDVAVEWV